MGIKRNNSSFKDLCLSVFQQWKSDMIGTDMVDALVPRYDPRTGETIFHARMLLIARTEYAPWDEEEFDKKAKKNDTVDGKKRKRNFFTFMRDLFRTTETV